MTRFLAATATAALAFGVSSAALAGGFGLKEGSASALGGAFSGATAGANDLTYSYWNPAALKSVEGVEIGGSLSGILPTAEGSRSDNGARVDGSLEAVVPATYLAARLGEKTVLGLSISSPFGLATEYDRGTLAATGAPGAPVRSQLTLIQIAPMLSYDVTPELTIAGGPTAVTGNLVFESFISGVVNNEIEVNATALGFQAGVLWSPLSSTSIGASFHSGYNLSADGESDLTGFFANQPASFSADLPALATLGFTQQVTDRLSVQGEAQWQQWSVLDHALITQANGTSSVAFDYEDAWLFALGAEYGATDQLMLRTGVAYDQTPTSDTTRSVRIPDQDRIWLSIGASYDVTERARIDIGYAYLFATEDAIASSGGTNTVTFDDLNAHILSVGGRIGF